MTSNDKMSYHKYTKQVFPTGWNPPADATELTFYDCSFVQMPTTWPSTLISVDIDTCTCMSEGEWTLPDTLVNLKLGFQTVCPTAFSSGLRTLMLRKMKCAGFPPFPAGLQKLHVIKGRAGQPAVLPPNLEYLYLFQTAWSDIPLPIPLSLSLIKLEEQYLEHYPVAGDEHPDLSVLYCEDCEFGDRPQEDDGLEDADSVS
jgi:hypothetical protein